MKRKEPRYSGPSRSGICVCGHEWKNHHLGIVMNEEWRKLSGEAYVPEECEFYGFNEMGGKDLEGRPHCERYKDSLEK